METQPLESPVAEAIAKSQSALTAYPDVSKKNGEETMPCVETLPSEALINSGKALPKAGDGVDGEEVRRANSSEVEAGVNDNCDNFQEEIGLTVAHYTQWILWEAAAEVQEQQPADAREITPNPPNVSEVEESKPKSQHSGKRDRKNKGRTNAKTSAGGSKEKHDEHEEQKTPVLPTAVEKVECMSPEEQNKVAGNPDKPRRGRPKKQAAKAKAKAKAKSSKEKANAAPKAKVKACKGGEPKKGKQKESIDKDEQHEEQEEQQEENGEETKEEVPRKVRKTRGASKTVVEAANDENTIPPPTKRVRGKQSPTKPARKSDKGKSSSEKAKGNKNNRDKKKSESEDVTITNGRSAETKAKLSRKSCAYKAARKKAQDEGLDKEECNRRARQAT